ncbi:TPA: hypothetical protein ACN35C_002503 [Vibrio parahaemolyticus]
MHTINFFEVEQILSNFESAFSSFEKPLIAHNDSKPKALNDFVEDMRTVNQTPMLMFAVYSPLAEMHEFVYVMKRGQTWIICLDHFSDIKSVTCRNIEFVAKYAAHTVQRHIDSYKHLSA